MPVTDEILFPLDDPDLIAFYIGAPDRSLLPLDILQRQTPVSLSSQNAYQALQYGPSLGSLSFRQTLASFLSQEYIGVPVQPEHLCVTSGASQSFFNLITLFADQDTVFLVENPTYFLALKMLQDDSIVSKDSIQAIDVDVDQGISIEAVKKVLNSHKDRVQKRRSTSKDSPSKRFSFFLFLVPTFSNPTGTSLSAERRKTLVELAREYDMLIVCDDVYQLLHFGTSLPPPRLVSYDLETLGDGSSGNSFGNVISNCSFSKLFAPGMRLGWVEAAPGIIQTLKSAALLYSGGCANHFGSSLMGQVIRSGEMLVHLKRVRKVYESRCQAMLQVLQKGLPNGVTIHSGPGGYFIWIEFHDKTIDTEALLQALLGNGPPYRGAGQGEKIVFTPGNRFSVDASHGHCLRLSFGIYPTPDLENGPVSPGQTLKGSLCRMAAKNAARSPSSVLSFKSFNDPVLESLGRVNKQP